MDTRDTPEQAELRRSARQLARELGPVTVADLDDATRAKRLATAVRDAGWLELRDDAGTGVPLASGVEAAIVADALGGSVADVAFAGPLLAADLARRAGAPAPDGRVVGFSADLLESARVTGSVTTAPLHAVDCAAEPVDGVYTLVSRARRLRPCRRAGRRGRERLGRWCRSHTRRAPRRRPARPWRRLPTVGSSRDDDLAAWTALGLALTSADLVGIMRGVLGVTVEYATERRQYGVPIGSFQAVQHLLAEAHCLDGGVAQRGAARGVGRRRARARRRARRGRVAKAYCARAARTVCETAIQVHGGIGNTWECIAHVYLRRALLSSQWFGDDGAQLLALQRTASRGRPMDFGDSPAEAEFRARLRAWLHENNPGLPASSTDDEYWARQAAWHTALYDAGFFGLSWPARYGGHGLPGVFDVILDDELAAAGAPPRPSLGYLVQGILEHGSDDIKQRFLPGLINGRDRWCQGFSEPDAGSDLASLRTTATRDGDEYVINGHKVWTSYSDVADWCLVLARTDPDVPKHKGISAFAVPMHQPGIEQRPLRMINGITKEFGEVLFDGARVAGREHDRRARRGLARSR